jgi:peptidyl-prolyl cis-trans isomerase SurA
VLHRLLFVLMALAVFGASAIGADAASHRPVHRPTQTASTGPAHSPQGPITQGAVAIVNDQIISDYDLNQRIALFIVTSGVRPTEQNLPLIRDQVLRSLEDELLEVKEAQTHGVTVTKEEVDTALAGIATDNHTTVAAITETLAKGGVALGTFQSQILAQIAWNKVVQGRYGSRLDIRDEEVAAAIDRIKQGASKPQFRVSEIFLAIDRPEDDAKVRASAAQLVAQINLGAPFSAVARQFSQSPSAANGGDIGWVVEGQLAEELDKALHDLHRGGVSPPIRSAGGYYILQLLGRLEPLGTHVPEVPHGPPTGPVPLARLLLPLPANAPAGYRQRAMDFAMNVSQKARSCADLQAIAAQTHIVYMSLGTISPKLLSADVQAALAKTEPGGIAAPFISAAGIEVIARCDARMDQPEVLTIPTAEQMKNELFQQRVGMLARSYLRDLRRDAVIETR